MSVSLGRQACAGFSGKAVTAPETTLSSEDVSANGPAPERSRTLTSEIVADRIVSSFSPRKRPASVPHRGRWTTLEPLSTTHTAALQTLALDAPESWEWLPAGPFVSGESFAAYLRMVAASHEEILWAVLPHRPDGTIGPAAGWLGLLDVNPRHARMELGNVWFPPGLARTRSATEATALLLGHVFDDLGYGRVAWKCDARHTASVRAAQRLGFRYEGTARAHMIVRGLGRDTAYYAMLREEWPDRRAALAAWLAPANFDAAGRAISSLRRAP